MSKTISTPDKDVAVNPVYLSARSAVIQPERAITVTHYSLNKWLPRLGAGRWALVQYLRGLCIDSPRRADGTKRVTISWRSLAEYLQVHEETIASWLKHEVIPDDKPWRRIAINDDYSQFLSLFIPRLRYAYESHNGKTRRVGFLLEILMEDPIAPEDEVQLKYQVEQIQLQQGAFALNTFRQSTFVNPANEDSPRSTAGATTGVNQFNNDLQAGGEMGARRFTTNRVNQDNSDLPPNVKQADLELQAPVNDGSLDLHSRKSENSTTNVNKLVILINDLKIKQLPKRNQRLFFEPLIVETEALLDDYHSRAMLYKVIRQLFPVHMDLFLDAIERALDAYSLDNSVNKGAIFVKSIKDMAKNEGLELGFKNGNLQINTNAFDVAHDKQPYVTDVTENEAIWSETLNILRGQMTRAMFNSIMQNTQLVTCERGVYVVSVGSAVAQEWLSSRLKNVVLRALNSVVGTVNDIQFQV